MDEKRKETISGLCCILEKGMQCCNGDNKNFHEVLSKYNNLKSDVRLLEEGDVISKICDLCFELISITSVGVLKKINLLNSIAKKINSCEDLSALVTSTEKRLIYNFIKYSNEHMSMGDSKKGNPKKITKIIMSSSTIYRNSRDYDAALKRMALKYMKEVLKILDTLIDCYLHVNVVSYSTYATAPKK